MLKNYLVVALRHLWRQKIYSFTNILGLAIGIAFCILTFRYIHNEWTYDTFHENLYRIYRIYEIRKNPNGEIRNSARVPTPLAAALKRDFPEIEKVVRFREEESVVRYKDKMFVENMLFAGPDVFEAFSFFLLNGDKTALHNRTAIVISQRMAHKYFDRENPIDKTLAVRINAEYIDFVVKGVVSEIPENSSLKFDFLLPFEMQPNYKRYADLWGSSRVVSYVLLSENADPLQLISKFPAFIQKYYQSTIQKYQEYDALALSDDALQLDLQPFHDVHLNADILGGLLPTGDRIFSFVLLGIALGVLLVACINFANISMALASTRLKEIGVRKVVGAERLQLMQQFWGEALLLSLIGLFVGIAFSELALPLFNSVANKELVLDYGSEVMAYLVVLSILVGIIAGSYPSIVLSGYSPIHTLKGSLKLGGSNFFSKALITTQFSVSIFLIIFAIVTFKQIDYLKTKDRGFQDEQVVVIDASQRDKEQRSDIYTVYKSELSRYPSVLGITASFVHFGGLIWTTSVKCKGSVIKVQFFDVAPNFIETLGIELSEGRGFIRDSNSDLHGSLIVNEALVRAFGWTSPIGKTLPEFSNRQIVGVVKDFHSRSLHHQIEPVVFELGRPDQYQYIYVRINPVEVQHTLNLLKKEWTELNPHIPFQFSFLDQDLDSQYRAEERWGRVSRSGSIFSIFIACIGIFSLAALAMNKRVKEIGIRRVLGASIWNVVFLFFGGYVKMIVVANLCVWPIAYYAVGRWLNDFAYHISFPIWAFAVSGFLTLFIILLTVSYHVLKAARSNPVDALRYE